MGCGCSNNQSLIFPPNSSRPPHAQSTIHIDQIAGLIGVSHKPHISKMKMEIEHFYYLFMCTDGVANCDDCERLANLIVGSERSSYIFYTIEFTEVMNNILSIGRGKYSGPYLPDMTLILRRLM